MATMIETASANLGAMSRNPYLGRGVIVGRALNGNLVQICWTMGRSPGSRNRVYEALPLKRGWVQTRVADTSQHTGDPALLIYPAMAEWDGCYVVSNGRQTEAVLLYTGLGVLGDWKYEPDAPHYTPRISGIAHTRGRDKLPGLSILRKRGDACVHDISLYSELTAGYGYYVSTYAGDGDPLPAFEGEPVLIPILGANAEEIAKQYWAVLDKKNRVSIAAKVIPPTHLKPSEVCIINQYKLVG